VRYAHERTQFGKPIASHQSVQSRLADMTIDLATARCLVRETCLAADSGALGARGAAIAKVFATEMASRVCDHALQVHGGYGYMVEFHVERQYRDAKVGEIAFGTSEALRLLVAQDLAREVDASPR
jgi:butyryl-CoA dehydrogenase